VLTREKGTPCAQAGLEAEKREINQHYPYIQHKLPPLKPS